MARCTNVTRFVLLPPYASGLGGGSERLDQDILWTGKCFLDNDKNKNADFNRADHEKVNARSKIFVRAHILNHVNLFYKHSLQICHCSLSTCIH
jgi:hypothetical protein